MNKYRISTNIGKDQFLTINLENSYDLLEILSLKISQTDVYRSFCSDYGVVVGRVTANNGFGVPNIRVSIFVPLDDVDVNDPVISVLYPYTTVEDKDDNNYRYNLLPSRKQHGGHEPTGTFPDQEDILTREEYLEVFEKYYKYTVKTNDAGDFMIWGVPLGQQTIHFDGDLSDIGCFSLRPDDFIRQGKGVDQFKNTYQFKSSEDLDSLPQIFKYNKTIQVSPFWGNQDICRIGITRTDFDLSSIGIKIQPKAYIIGGTFTDTGKNSINKNCQPRKKMGRKCDLTTKAGKIEAIRFSYANDESNRPILEYFDLHEDISDDGGFSFPVPMNRDFLYTNEFGEQEYTNDPNKGIPTSSCYRFRFSLKDGGLERVRAIGSYLVPNIREYENEKQQSYNFTTEYSGYPSNSQSLILNNIDGFYYPQDYFYRITYGKVYTVSSFQSSFFPGSTFKKDNFLGLKELLPAEEEDCSSTHNTPPVNFGIKNYTFTLLIADVLAFIDWLFNSVKLIFFNVLVNALYSLGNTCNHRPIRFVGRAILRIARNVQEGSQKKLYLVTYPDCVECTTSSATNSPKEINVNDSCPIGSFTFSTSYTMPEESPSYFVSSGLTITFSGASDFPNSPCSGSTFIGNLTYTYKTYVYNNITNTYDTVEVTTPPQPDYLTFYAIQSGYSLGISGVTNNTFTVINLSDLLIPTNLTESTYFRNPQPIYYHDYDPLNPQIIGYTIDFQDNNNIFEYSPETYVVTIYDNNVSKTGVPLIPLEEGCQLYNIPYNSHIVNTYYTGTTNNFTRVLVPNGTPSNEIIDVVATTIYNEGGNLLPPNYSRITHESGGSEFSYGIYYIVPGTQTTGRLIDILFEYKVRRRVGKLFCGGIVNYSFIDNWLSGSLYFFLFKAKHGKYCGNVVTYSDNDQMFYYRSSPFDGTNFGINENKGGTNVEFLGKPTTMVDLGPRDVFMGEICCDPSLDVNCSVSRLIGATSYQDIGDILGLTINYRLETKLTDLGSDISFDIDYFFTNSGFTNIGADEPLNGDILQLISQNSEAGIEVFDLQNPYYVGYDYQFIQPRFEPQFFKLNNGSWGPTPITFKLDNLNGEKIRGCLNSPGRLTESSQPIPFYLWDKKATGFGDSVNQSWDYGNVQIQPLQGMTYGYQFSGAPNHPIDKYLLLPITNTFSGLTINVNGIISNVLEFDTIDYGLIDNHMDYNTEFPGFTYLYVTGTGLVQGQVIATGGTLYTRYGPAGTDGVTGWNVLDWIIEDGCIIPQTQDYYSGNKQILSTPFQYYFGLKHGSTGLDKFIERFGPTNAFTTVN